MRRLREKLRSFIFSEKTNKTLFYGKYQGGRQLSFIKKILIIFLDLRTLRDYFNYHNNFLILKTFGKAQKREVKVALSNTFGFGGHNACVLFKEIG